MLPDPILMSLAEDESELYEPPRLVEYGPLEELTQLPNHTGP